MPHLVAQAPRILSLDWLREHGIRIAVVLALALAVSWMAGAAVRRMRRRLERSESVTQELDLARSATLTSALSSAVRFVIWTFAVLLVLGEFGLNLGPLIAGAGVAGVALGFGAQSLVKDFLSGFFILLEEQFAVGQVVRLETSGGRVTGKIESMSLRVTALRDFDGTLHVVPNGNILLVGNMFRGWARAIVDVAVAYDEDLDRVREILDELCEEVRQDASISGVLFSGPEVLGIERVGDQEAVFRVVAQVKPSRRPDIERELRRRMKERVDERGIRVPMPRRVMLAGSEAG